jgi:hypothetical protein
MATSSEWLELADRLEQAGGPDYDLDIALARAVYPRAPVNYDPETWVIRRGGFTDSLDGIADLIEAALPGWWWSCGSCHLTGDGDVGDMNQVRLKTHATLAPDYNDPLAKGLPEISARHEYDEGFSTSIDGRGKHFAALALCVSFCRAMAAKCEDGGE